jgi:hypothetical protein
MINEGKNNLELIKYSKVCKVCVKVLSSKNLTGCCSHENKDILPNVGDTQVSFMKAAFLSLEETTKE